MRGVEQIEPELRHAAYPGRPLSTAAYTIIKTLYVLMTYGRLVGEEGRKTTRPVRRGEAGQWHVAAVYARDGGGQAIKKCDTWALCGVHSAVISVDGVLAAYERDGRTPDGWYVTGSIEYTNYGPDDNPPSVFCLRTALEKTLSDNMAASLEMVAPHDRAATAPAPEVADPTATTADPDPAA